VEESRSAQLVGICHVSRSHVVIFRLTITQNVLSSRTIRREGIPIFTNASSRS